MTKEPETIAELQAEIGRLTAKLASKVLGDQTKGVSFTAFDGPATFRHKPPCPVLTAAGDPQCTCPPVKFSGRMTFR